MEMVEDKMSIFKRTPLPQKRSLYTLTGHNVAESAIDSHLYKTLGIEIIELLIVAY